MTLCPNTTAPNRRALTATEVLLVLCALFFVAAMLLPALANKSRRPTISMCSANIKQVALAFLLWAEDSKTTRFPWEVQGPTGTLQHATSPQVFRHFIAVSNQLQDPRRLLCPADKARKAAASWQAVKNENISYLINLPSASNWDLTNLQNIMILGDRNLSTNDNVLRGYYEISDPTPLRWTKDIHQHHGNVTMADGSSHKTTIIGVQSLLTNVAVRLAIP